MKKLYRKGTVHPSPPTISDQLSFLPATILTLTVALSPQDREVLAYLISCSSNNFSGNPRRTNAAVPKGVVDGDHPPLFNCSCFRCYMSYWVRWDTSPNHQLIHEIIDAFEDSLAQTAKTAKNNNGNGRKDKRNKRASNNKSTELNSSESVSPQHNASVESESVGESSNSNVSGGDVEVDEAGDGGENEEKGSVRRFVSFIGERIWGGWGQ
ncbi:uncharacterized protein LOC133286444 [Gastrolobium bilobum]|uniref:uncharacterized protein LOC133286444 n=1 Tax=Gastrolobium bilobum TaxID=150636 RepID=UPI002AB1B29A|nr:uncharacterized protein LOC133286444 [Gastrolobium bilobum]